MHIDSILSLPDEILRHFCEFLPSQDGIHFGQSHSRIYQLILQEKGKEERKLIDQLHHTVQRIGGLLFPSLKREIYTIPPYQDSFILFSPTGEEMRGIPIYEESEKNHQAWEDIRSQEQIWVRQVVDAFISLDGPGSLHDRHIALNNVRVNWLSILDPFRYTLNEEHIPKSIREKISWQITYKEEKERGLFSAVEPRMYMALTILITNLLAIDRSKYDLVTQKALEGEYRGEDEQTILEILFKLKAVESRNMEELLPIARRMDPNRQQGICLWMVGELLREKRFPRLFLFIDQLFQEEDLSVNIQKEMIRILVKVDVSRGLAKAESLSDRQLQREVFLDLFHSFLHVVLLAERGVWNRMVALMEQVAGREEEGDAFETIRMLKFLIENEPQEGKLKAAITSLRNEPQEMTPLRAASIIFAIAVRWRFGDREVCETVLRAIQILEQKKAGIRQEIFDLAKQLSE